jgi:hypothetical protein
MEVLNGNSWIMNKASDPDCPGKLGVNEFLVAGNPQCSGNEPDDCRF